MGPDQEPLSGKKSWNTAGALFYEIKGPDYCAEETAVMVELWKYPCFEMLVLLLLA